MFRSWSNVKNVRIFYGKRFSSLIPGYYLAILFYVCFNLLLNNNFGNFYPFDISTKSILLNILLLHGVSPTSFNSVVPGGWFIGTQCIFVVLFPALYNIFEKTKGKIKFKNIPYYSFCISAIVQIIIYLYSNNYNYIKITSFLHYSFINQLPCFLLGISLAYEYKKTSFKDKKIDKEFIIGVLVAGIAVLLFYLSNTVAIFSVFVAFAFSIAFKHLFIIFVLLARTKKINTNFWVKLGKVSYAAYYTNFIVCMMIPWLIFKYVTFNLNINIIYFCGIIPMIYGTYQSAVWLNKVIIILESKISDLIGIDKLTQKG